MAPKEGGVLVEVIPKPKILLILVCVGLLTLTACLTVAQQEAIKHAAEVTGAVAPILPPPFGLIAGAIATALSGVAAIGANKASNTAFKKKEVAPALIRLWTDHSSTLMGGLLTAVMAARASGLIHMSDTELALLTTTLAAPVGTKKVMRR